MTAWPVEIPERIIVRMPNWMGDLVMATPVLKALREHYPMAEITAMCPKKICHLISKNPYINEIFCFQPPSRWIHRQRHLEIIESLRKGEYDLGVLLTNSFSSAWWFWRGRVKNRIGYAANLRSILLNRALRFPKQIEDLHQVAVYKELLGGLSIFPKKFVPKLYLADEEVEEAKMLFERQGVRYGKDRVIGINPGAAYGTAKCWPPERFAEVAKRLLEEDDIYVICFSDAAGVPVVDKICAPFLHSSRVINLGGKTSIRQLMGLISCCSLFLTNDSGPMHVAAALGVPLLALFGSTSAKRTAPCPGGEVISKNVECSPCYKRVCPIDFRCMKRIGVDEVYEKLKKMMDDERI